MKEQTIRGILMAGLMTALGLAGCHVVGPESTHTVSLPDRTGTVSQSEKPEGGPPTTPAAENVASTPPAASVPAPGGEVPVSITRTVEPASGGPTLPDLVPPSQLALASRETTSRVEKPSPGTTTTVTAMATTPAPLITTAPIVSNNGHAQDYGWLSGEVERSRLPKGWRLRYTRVDEEDAHGGSVLLVSDSAQFDHLQEGQRVRVTGRLVNTDSHTAGAPYKVETLQVLSK